MKPFSGLMVTLILVYLTSVEGVNFLRTVVKRGIQRSAIQPSKRIKTPTAEKVQSYHALRDADDWPDASPLIPGLGRYRRRRRYSEDQVNEALTTGSPSESIDGSTTIQPQFSDHTLKDETVRRKILPDTESAPTE